MDDVAPNTDDVLLPGALLEKIESSSERALYLSDDDSAELEGEELERLKSAMDLDAWLIGAAGVGVIVAPLKAAKDAWPLA